MRAAGGLFIIGTERHESRRIDNQLRGRAGRQGDPGASRFFLSLEDDLMRIFGGDRVQSLMDSLGLDEDVPIENKLITNTIESAQKKLEASNFAIRKQVLQYDDVMNQQREIIYKQRQMVLDGEDISGKLHEMMRQAIDDACTNYLNGETADDWDFAGLRRHFMNWLCLPTDFNYTTEQLGDLTKEGIADELYKRGMDILAAKEKRYGAKTMRELERICLLRNVDSKWMEHIDAMDELRKGIYLRRTSIPSYFGMINNPYGNIGKVENKGIEMSVSYANSWRDWSLSVMGNYSFNRNKVLEDDSTVAYPWQKTIGNKVDQRFGLIALGLFESPEEIAAAPVQVGDTRPGDIRYKDINGDGKIDEYDKVPIGWGSVPEIVYGFGFSVGWKGLSLSAMFQGAAHVDAILSGEGVLPFAQGSSRGNLLSNITDRWTEANPRQDVFYPRLSIGNMNMNYEASTWWLKNTSYLRLKNIELSYTLPDRWMKRIHINNARIFIQGVNLLTFSKFKLWDVELGDGRGAKYPNIGSVSLGINFNF